MPETAIYLQSDERDLFIDFRANQDFYKLCKLNKRTINYIYLNGGFDICNGEFAFRTNGNKVACGYSKKCS
jgi:hypothetical protein